MFSTIERATRPTPGPTRGLRRVAYPDLSLYLGRVDTRSRRRFARSLTKDEVEIKYVESEHATFLVNPQGLTTALTMALIWGSLGMSLEKTARDLDIAEN